MQGNALGLGAVYRFMTGGGFPAFALTVIAGYELLLIGLLVAPPAPAGLGGFAEEFRIWCFGYDPATGRFEWMYAIGVIGPPLMIAGLVTLVWWEPLRELIARPLALLRYALAAGLLVVASAAGLAMVAASPSAGELPFPAEALRTAQRAPDLPLVNQAGERIDLAEQRGRVVMLTAVYASCPHACPLILAQARRVIEELGPAEREDLRLVAVTMDPEHDAPDVLAELARLHELDLPLYNLVTGPPVEVERVLDEMGMTRRRDPETGVIDHPSLFVLIDREGKVAYRLTLGEQQERWLQSALRVLLAEAASPLADGPQRLLH